MSFRRTKQATETRRRWRQFLETHRDLLAATGLPLSLYEAQAGFADVLRHGYYHTDPAQFSVEMLNAEQRALLIDAIVAYLQAGFDDPGIVCFPAAVRDEIMRRAQERETNV